ncbi:hypothetical protein [Sediminimonas sp.]|uniref:hypothetical protein n=1 Tax=Sediminimonas sp. TaxID=2823379 RepID=UPI0025EB4CF1|nr:hypothetical protein [Sediminimonas sp.]
MSNHLSAADRHLIENYIARNGVTECPRGASGEIPEYVWKPSRSGEGGALVVLDGQGAFGKERINARTRGMISEQARQRRVMRAEGRLP